MNQQQQQSGEQQPRQQPLYDISQGGHYGKSKSSRVTSSYSNNPFVYAVTARDSHLLQYRASITAANLVSLAGASAAVRNSFPLHPTTHQSATITSTIQSQCLPSEPRAPSLPRRSSCERFGNCTRPINWCHQNILLCQKMNPKKNHKLMTTNNSSRRKVTYPTQSFMAVCGRM